MWHHDLSQGLTMVATDSNEPTRPTSGEAAPLDSTVEGSKRAGRGTSNSTIPPSNSEQVLLVHLVDTETTPATSTKWCGGRFKTWILAIMAVVSLTGLSNLLLQSQRAGGGVLVHVQKAAAGADNLTTLDSSELAWDVAKVPSPKRTRDAPDWFVSYVDWHREVKSTLTEENWDQHQYFVLRCLGQCSGTTDRLRSFLFLIYLAQSDPYNEHRIFLIHWRRPAAIEEFLVPPPGGLDWRVPDWLLPKLNLGDSWQWEDVPLDEESFLQKYRNKSNYDVLEIGWIFPLHRIVDRLERQYRTCFRALFQPVPGVQELVDKTEAELGLTHERYTAVHLRTKYWSDIRDDEHIWKALTCAAKIGDPTAPIFVASDSAERAARALEVAVERNFSRTVVTRTDYDLYPPLHIDCGTDFLNEHIEDRKEHNVSDYYTVFSDLWLLGDSSCVVAGTGSYGKWGSQISRNVSCFGNFMTGEGC